MGPCQTSRVALRSQLSQASMSRLWGSVTSFLVVDDSEVVGSILVVAGVALVVLVKALLSSSSTNSSFRLRSQMYILAKTQKTEFENFLLEPRFTSGIMATPLMRFSLSSMALMAAPWIRPSVNVLVITAMAMMRQPQL